MTEIRVSDAALGDADGVFRAAVEHLARKLSAIQPLDPATIPSERVAAIAALDVWAAGRMGSWRTELVRFYEAHAPSALRPDPALNAVLRRARRAGVRIVVVSPLPREAAELYCAQLGVARAVAAILAEGEEAAEPVIASRAALAAALA